MSPYFLAKKNISMKRFIFILSLSVSAFLSFAQASFVHIYEGEIYQWILYQCNTTDTIVYYDMESDSYDTIIGNTLSLSPTVSNGYRIISVNGISYNYCQNELVIDVYPSYTPNISHSNTSCTSCNDGSITISYTSEAQGKDYILKVYDDNYNLVYANMGAFGFGGSNDIHSINNLAPGAYKIHMHQKIWGFDKYGFQEQTLIIE